MLAGERPGLVDTSPRTICPQAFLSWPMLAIGERPWRPLKLNSPPPSARSGMPEGPWGAKRALKPKQIWGIRFYLNQRRRLRDRALFDLAIDSKLRGCDLVQMKIGDIVSGGQIQTLAIVMQQKTGRPVQFELLQDVRASLLAWAGSARRRSGVPPELSELAEAGMAVFGQAMETWLVSSSDSLETCLDLAFRVWGSLVSGDRCSQSRSAGYGRPDVQKSRLKSPALVGRRYKLGSREWPLSVIAS